MLTFQDEAIASWLAAISPLALSIEHFSPVSVSIRDGVITARCSHQCIAYSLRRHDSLLQKSGYGLKILVGEKQYAFIPPQAPMNIIRDNLTLDNSRWARMNSAVLDLMADDGTISIHSNDRDSGYSILTICPYRAINAVLCLPKEQLVGKAVLDAWDKSRAETEVIAVTKQRVIKEAIATGQKTTHTYEMMWNGILWQKAISGVVVGDEVICITRNLQDYQRKFWENWVS